MIRPEPRYRTERDTSRRTFGPQVLHYARRLGRSREPYAWQVELANLAGELIESDSGLLVPAFRTVAYTVPRQQGKTTVMQAFVQQRATGDPWRKRGRQRILYSAQTGKDAAEKITEDWHPEFMAARRMLGVSSFPRSRGAEGVRWANGSRLSTMSEDAASGHGKTLHLGMQDEMFRDVDSRRDGAMIPAMTTIEDAQMHKTSTAGTAESAVWNAVVARGRMAIERGDTSGMCYVEYSASPGPDLDIDDPRVWMECMPALRHEGNPGGVITFDTIRDARKSLGSDAEFMRAYLNVPTGVLADSVFGTGVWERGHVSAGQRLVPQRAMQLAVDVTMQRDVGYLAAAVRDPVQGVLTDTVGTFPGLVGLVDAMVELWETWRIPFAVDPGGPAAAAALEAQGRGVGVTMVSTRSYAAWCGGMFDAATAAIPDVWHPKSADLDGAVTEVQRRKVGDSWVWDRRAPVDPAPFCAHTLARGALVSTEGSADYDLSMSVH